MCSGTLSSFEGCHSTSLTVERAQYNLWEGYCDAQRKSCSTTDCVGDRNIPLPAGVALDIPTSTQHVNFVITDPGYTTGEPSSMETHTLGYLRFPEGFNSDQPRKENARTRWCRTKVEHHFLTGRLTWPFARTVGRLRSSTALRSRMARRRSHDFPTTATATRCGDRVPAEEVWWQHA